MFILSSHFIHKIGEALYDLAIPLLILYATGSSVLMGTMYALGFMAEFLVGFFGGSIIDSVNRKKLLITISLLQTLFISILPLSANLGFFNVIFIFVVAFILDMCIALYRIVDISIVPQLLDKKELPQANGYMQMAISSAEAVGPAISGLLIAIAGLFGSLWINVGTFLLLLSTLSLIRYQTIEQKTGVSNPKQIWSSSVEGLLYTLKNKLFRTILIWNLFVNFGLSGAVLMILFHVKEVIGLSSTEIGLVMTMSAIGGIISGLIFSRIQSMFNSGRLLLVSSLVVSLALFSFPFQIHWFFAGTSVCVLMFSIGINSRLIHMLFQLNVPDNMLGRVLSASRLISTMLAPLSVMIAGWITEVYQSTYVFAGGGVIIVLSTLIAFTTKLKSANWGIKQSSLSQETSAP